MEIVAEEWRSAVGYEGFYEVSSLGNVRSLDRLVPAKVGNGRQYWGTRLHRGKELTPTGHRKHYLKIEASIENRQHTVLVHRMVADAFLGPRPEGCEVNHIDGNKHNNAAENLEYVTKAENMRHALDSGLVAVGEARSNAKYTTPQVKWALALVHSGMSVKEAAEQTGLPAGRLSKIRRGEIWRHLGVA